jgi:hypothetical protein
VRLKSALWVQAFLRTNEIQGRFGAVLRKGAEEAGAVWVVINHLDGTSTLLEPAPGPAYDDAGNRRFIDSFGAPQDWAKLRERTERAERIDADIWIIEAEDRNGLAGLSPEQH